MEVLIKSEKHYKIFTEVEDFESKRFCMICGNPVGFRNTVCDKCFIVCKCTQCGRETKVKPNDHKRRRITNLINKIDYKCGNCSKKWSKDRIERRKELYKNNPEYKKMMLKNLEGGRTPEARRKAGEQIKNLCRLGKFNLNGVKAMNSPECMKKKFSPESNKRRIETKIANGSMDYWIKTINSGESLRKRNETFRNYMDINNNSPEAIRYRNMIKNNLGGASYSYNENGEVVCINNVKIEDIFKSVNDFYLDYNGVFINTGLTQESENWLNIRAGFEQNLANLDVKWFCYIKFAIINRESVPYSVCKSGSIIVNKRGSDVSFSTREDSASRKYLKENNLLWDKTRIFIIPCKSEKEALRVEKEIQNKYNLFG